MRRAVGQQAPLVGAEHTGPPGRRRVEGQLVDGCPERRGPPGVPDPREQFVRHRQRPGLAPPASGVPCGAGGLAAPLAGLAGERQPERVVQRVGGQDSSVPGSTRDGVPGSASSASPTTRTSAPKVQSPRTVSEAASRRDGGPSGKRASKSPTNL